MLKFKYTDYDGDERMFDRTLKALPEAIYKTYGFDVVVTVDNYPYATVYCPDALVPTDDRGHRLTYAFNSGDTVLTAADYANKYSSKAYRRV